MKTLLKAIFSVENYVENSLEAPPAGLFLLVSLTTLRKEKTPRHDRQLLPIRSNMNKNRVCP